MSDAEHIYSIGDRHAQTIQVCVDRLQQLGANQQLKRLTRRLQKLADRATAIGDDKGAKALGANRGGLRI